MRSESVITDNLLSYIGSDKNILFILPTKYQRLLMAQLLKKVTSINNKTFMSINNFLNNSLEQTNNYEDEAALIRKLHIHQKLNAARAEHENNINFVTELFKLENEIRYSNVRLENNDCSYLKYLDTKVITFDNLNLPYDEVIILSKEEFYPLHDMFMARVKELVKVVDLTAEGSSVMEAKTTVNFFELNNNIRMVDALIWDLKSNNKEGLVICDNETLISYLVNKLNNVGISTYQSKAQNSKEMLAFLKAYERYYAKSFLEQDYQSLVKALYTALVELNFFELDDLNELFSRVYPLKNIDNKLIVQLLKEELLHKLGEKDTNYDAAVIIGDSNFLSLKFKQIWLLDGAIPSLTPQKVSFLLTTKEREQLHAGLLTNAYYYQQYLKKIADLKCLAKHLDIYYSLLSWDNKAQKINFSLEDCLIKDENKTVLNLKCDDDITFYHFTNQETPSSARYSGNATCKLNDDNVKAKLNNRLNVSASSLTTFLECEYKYFIDYLLRIPSAKLLNAASIGKAVHQAIENINLTLINKTSINEETTLKNLIEQHFMTARQTLCSEYEITDKVMLFDLEVIFKKYLHKYLYLHGAFAKCTNYKVCQAELKREHEYQTGVYIKGSVDALCSNEHHNLVIDYKTGEKNDLLQLIFYQYLLAAEYPNLATALYCSLKPKYEVVASQALVDEYLDKDNYYNTLFNGYSDDPEIVKAKNLFKIKRNFNISAEIKDLETAIETLLAAFEELIFNINPQGESCALCKYKPICKYNKFYEDEVGEEHELSH